MAFDKAKELERRIQHHMGRCVHFTGARNDTCKAGVNYRTLVGGPDFGWATRLPCFTDAPSDAPPCDQRRYTTREEAEAEVNAKDESYQRVSICMKAIREKHGKERGVADSMPCPNCCGGTLGYSIAGSNGHVWGSCSTPGCAQWMQ